MIEREFPSMKERIQGFLSNFIPVDGYFITPIILSINVAVFILMCLGGADIMQPSSEILVKFGANFTPYSLLSEPWRLISCAFVHIGLFHILMNMYAFYYIGSILEPFLGRTRFAAAYLLTAISSSLCSLWWHDITISAGASGAIFGMYGLFLALLTTDLIRESVRKPMLSSIAFFVGFNLFIGVAGRIDNAGHIGGLIGGVLIGYAFLKSLRSSHDKKLENTTVSIVAVVFLIVSFFFYQKLQSNFKMNHPEPISINEE